MGADKGLGSWEDIADQAEETTEAPVATEAPVEEENTDGNS